NCIAVIGDIHGCIKELTELYEKLSEFDVPVYSVGDFIDRGEHSQEVIDFMVEKKIKAVTGNHEAWFLEAMTEDVERFKNWIHCGGGPTLRSYVSNLEGLTVKGYRDIMIKTGHYDFIASLPMKFEINNVFISHAGKVEGGDDASLYFNYREPEKIKGKLQVFGHKPKDNLVYEKGWYANVDTGCVYGNALTAVIVDTVNGEIVDQVAVGSY
ncbi:MAG: metallophosphoesterase, partial [Ignavibacteriota bacterium]